MRRFPRAFPAGVSESGWGRTVPARRRDPLSARLPGDGERASGDRIRTACAGRSRRVLERRPRRDGDGAGPVHAVGRPPASATPLRARRGRRPCRFPVLLRRTPGNAGGRRGPMARSGAPGAVLPGAVLASPVDRCGPERVHRVRLDLRRGSARSRRVPGLRHSPRPVVAGRVRGRRGGPGCARLVGSDRNCRVPPGRSGRVPHEPARVAGRRAGVARRGRMAFPAAHRTGRYGPAPCPFFSGAGGGRLGLSRRLDRKARRRRGSLAGVAMGRPRRWCRREPAPPGAARGDRTGGRPRVPRPGFPPGRVHREAGRGALLHGGGTVDPGWRGRARLRVGRF